MGGDVWQWNEANIDGYRGLGGGSWAGDSDDLASSYGNYDGPVPDGRGRQNRFSRGKAKRS